MFECCCFITHPTVQPTKNQAKTTDARSAVWYRWVAKKWKEVRPTTIQKMCDLQGMHPNNASTRCAYKKILTHRFFLKNFENTQSQCPPSYMLMPPPPPGKKNPAPLCQWPPSRERRILARAIAGGGGMVGINLLINLRTEKIQSKQ